MEIYDNSSEKKILEATFKVIDEYTISGTRMGLIAKECEMAQSNLHYHFKTKEKLLVALLSYIQDYFGKDRKNTLNQFSNTLEGQLSGFFEQKKNLILEKPQYDRVQMDYWCYGQVNEEVRKSIVDSYDIWRNHIMEVILLYDPFVEREKASIVSHIMISMMVGASYQYLVNIGSFSLDDYIQTCVKMIIKYLK